MVNEERLLKEYSEVNQMIRIAMQIAVSMAALHISVQGALIVGFRYALEPNFEQWAVYPAPAGSYCVDMGTFLALVGVAWSVCSSYFGFRFVKYMNYLGQRASELEVALEMNTIRTLFAYWQKTVFGAGATAGFLFMAMFFGLLWGLAGVWSVDVCG